MKKGQVAAIVLMCLVIVVLGVGCFFLYEGKDKTPPVITMESDSIEVSVSAVDKTYLQGVSAFDQEDGDVSDSLIVEKISEVGSGGARKVVIVASDHSGNTAKVTRDVYYVDYEGARFSVNSPLRFPVGTENEEIIAPVRIVDSIDGDMSSSIVARSVDENNKIDTQKPGFYPVNFSVKNSMNDVVEFQTTVEVYDPVIEVFTPDIALNTYMVYIPAGEYLDTNSIVQRVVLNGNTYERDENGKMVCTESEKGKAEVGKEMPEGTVMISGVLDTTVAGWYEVAYTVINESNYGKTVRMLVCAVSL